TTNRLDAASIRAAVAESIALSKAASADPELLPMAEPAPITEVNRFDRSTAETSPMERARAVSEAIRVVEAAGQTAAGIYSTGQDVEALFNSQGIAAWHAETMANFSITAMAGNSSGWAKGSAVASGAMDPVAKQRTASEKARRSNDPSDIPARRSTVILQPAAGRARVGQMLGDS